MKKILIFGCGAMGGAILSGCLAKGLWKKEEIYVKEHSEEASREKASRYGVHASMDGREAKEADLVILAVKPNVVPGVLQEISRYHPSRVLSIAAAVTLEALEGALPEETEVIRVMPNTPASVGEGMAAIAPGKKASPDFIREAEEIFSALGKEAVVTERQLDELGALSGAGPGYAFVIIDALADAGVLIGPPLQAFMPWKGTASGPPSWMASRRALKNLTPWQENKKAQERGRCSVSPASQSRESTGSS